MAHDTDLSPHDEQQVARWNAFYDSVHDVLRQRPRSPMLAARSCASAIRERIDHGMQSVPVYKIMLEPPRFALFDSLVVPRDTPPADVPVALYQIGAAYMVKEGMQRVAHARTRGTMFVQAHVVECKLEPAGSAQTARPALLNAERRAFLATTRLDQSRPQHQIGLTSLGSYDRLLRHIASQTGVLPAAPPEEFVALWYDTFYQPVARALLRRGWAQRFPHHTPTDAYLWAMQRAASAPNAAARVRAALRLLSALLSAHPR